MDVFHREKGGVTELLAKEKKELFSVLRGVGGGGDCKGFILHMPLLPLGDGEGPLGR